MDQDAQNIPTAMKVKVGVITNSDDRVPSILSNLGLSVGSLRHGMVTGSSNLASDGVAKSDIDFVVLSYDVGSQKPSRRIFDAAKDLVKCGNDPSDWKRYLHVGDDPDKDFFGATHADWEAILLDREGNHTSLRPGVANASIPSLRALLPRVKHGWSGEIVGDSSEQEDTSPHGCLAGERK